MKAVPKDIISAAFELSHAQQYHVASHIAENIGHDIVKSDVLAKCILLTPHEIQSGLDRVRYAENLIRQLPRGHEGRNTWLSRYSANLSVDPDPHEHMKRELVPLSQLVSLIAGAQGHVPVYEATHRFEPSPLCTCGWANGDDDGTEGGGHAVECPARYHPARDRPGTHLSWGNRFWRWIFK